MKLTFLRSTIAHADRSSRLLPSWPSLDSFWPSSPWSSGVQPAWPSTSPPLSPYWPWVWKAMTLKTKKKTSRSAHSLWSLLELEKLLVASLMVICKINSAPKRSSSFKFWRCCLVSVSSSGTLTRISFTCGELWPWTLSGGCKTVEWTTSFGASVGSSLKMHSFLSAWWLSFRTFPASSLSVLSPSSRSKVTTSSTTASWASTLYSLGSCSLPFSSWSLTQSKKRTRKLLK